ncbi:MAG: hypothetical protein N2112_01810 [Gemmataceae bacterium]|nr:hypothetical protein [Gemmataceae bacterium]
MRCTCFFFVLVSFGSLLADDKDMKLAYTHYNKGYFEKNSSGLKGEASYLVISDREKFDSIFGVGFVMGPKPVLLPNDADEFKKLLVIATIKRGNSITNYEIKGVTITEGVVTLDYKATAEAPSTATFASPLILSIPKEKVKKVIFNENGKKVHEEAVK